MSFWSRLANVFRGDRLIDDIDEELQSHIAEAIEHGRTEAEARRSLGPALRWREGSRDARSLVWLDDFLLDLRYALRALARQPTFFAIALLTLAFGIGANVAIFSLIDALMLRALPVTDPDRLVQISRVNADGQPGGAFSYPLYEYVRDRSRVFDGMFAQSSVSRTRVDLRGASEQVDETMVTGSYYQVLGLRPAAGRLLLSSDDVPGAPAAAVISYAYWQRRFALDPSAIGASLVQDGNAFTIVGVTPPGFSGTIVGVDPDVTIPLATFHLTADGRVDFWRSSDGFNFLSVMARLPADTPIARAASEVGGIFASRQRVVAAQVRNPNEVRRILGQRMVIASARGGFSRLRTRFGQPLFVLMAITGLVLLLACANLSGLLVARVSARAREIRIRCAIGAGRGRLIRQLLTESLLLAVLGSIASVTLAGWFASVLVTMMANGGTLLLPTPLDWRIVLFVGATTLVIAILIGLVPAIQATGAAVAPGIRDVRGATPRRIGRVLVIGQIAISFVLIVGAALFVDTLVRLYAIDAGFRRTGVLTFGLDSKEKPASAHRQAVESEVLRRIAAVPGVESISAAQILFISGGGWNSEIHAEGYRPAPNEEPIVDVNVVAPGFFRTMGTPLIAGRDFAPGDVDPLEPIDDSTIVPAGHVAIVNERFAKAYFAGGEAVGHYLTFGRSPKRYEIIGVVKDAKYLDLKEAFPKTVYFALGRKRAGAPTLLVRTAASDPLWIVPQIEAVLGSLDPSMHLQNVHTFAEQVDRSILNERIMATLGGFFGALALLIACVGVFGVMAFQVGQRTREFGVRMALGAARSDVTTLVLRDVSAIVIVGTAIGAGAALALTRFARSFLFGVTPTDPSTYALAVAVLAFASLAAGYVPARRAARVDPIVALRHD